MFVRIVANGGLMSLPTPMGKWPCCFWVYVKKITMTITLLIMYVSTFF